MTSLEKTIETLDKKVVKLEEALHECQRERQRLERENFKLMTELLEKKGE